MEEQMSSILIVDDEPSNLKLLNQILGADYDIMIARSGEEAIETAKGEHPDLILLDIIMEGMSGLDVLRILKDTPETQDTPVIFITGLSGEDDEERGLLLGAVDYIMKPFRNAIVRARVQNQMKILSQRREIERLSLIDPLTNIPNRRNFNQQLTLEWARAAREKTPLSLLMIDVDKFKTYNDTYGHPQGDKLLTALGEILSKIPKRSGDIAARLGGEEFAVLLPNTPAEGAISVAEQLRIKVEAARVPLSDGQDTSTTVSIGAASFVPSGEVTPEMLMQRADESLYTAKESGRNRVCCRDCE
jgi:diguanylate cyclase (GGDEF)-like protein